PGDTLYHIANTYETTIDRLIAANELDAPDNLVVGQALVIPIEGEFYIIQQGDSLYKIAEMFDISVEELARINNLTIGVVLPIGLKLYIPEEPRPPITSNAYIEPTGDTVSETLINAATKTTPFLTYLAPFSYRVNRDGTLDPPPLDNFQDIASANDTALMMTITNLEGPSFSTELGHIILSVQAVQNTLLDNIVHIAGEIGFTDIHFDFEFLPPEDREAYNDFHRKSRDSCQQDHLNLSSVLPPLSRADQHGVAFIVQDYLTQGEFVVMVVLLTFEWGYSGGPARAVSPVILVRGVVEYALTGVPADY